MNPIEALKFEAEMRGKKTYSPAEAKQNIARTLEGAARTMPILGNALSVRDIAEAKGEAQRFREQGFDQNADRQDRLALAAVPGAVLPAMSGAASAEGAASRAGVFVPAGEKTVERVREMASRIAAGERTSIGSGRFPPSERGFVSPEGIVKSEISDLPMTMQPRRFAPGDKAPLGDVVEHPELFDRYKVLKDAPVQFGQPTGRSDPVARTFGDTMELAPRSYDSRTNPDWMRRNIAKLLQYKVSQGSNFALATKHGTDNTLAAIDDALARTRDAMEGNTLSNIGNKYIHYLNGMRDRITSKMRAGANDPWVAERFSDPDVTPTRKDISRILSEGIAARTAGNLEAQVTRQRFSNPGDATPPANMNYGGLIVLPPAGGNISEFINNWARYGQGSGRYGKPMPLE